MRKQQAIWLQEHTDKGTLPSMANVEPGSGVLLFTEWLKSQDHHTPGTAVDIGCGKGRNSVHLASLGYDVWALEYIEPAIHVAKELATARGLAEHIHFELTDIDSTWPVQDEFFDIAVDSFSSIDIETKAGREKYRDEMYRTLKPGGYAFVGVCSAEDEWEKELIANHPGEEPNSTIWPQNGKFQKDYSESELQEFYNLFEIVRLETLQTPAFKLGKNGTATNFWLVLKKN